MFEFLKYIQPLCYYRLAIDSANNCEFIKLFNQNEVKLIADNRYSNVDAIFMDKAYRALQMGVIPQRNISPNNNVNIQMVTHRNDNYKFVAKYFGKAKLVYVLLLRILSLNNPILELLGFIKAIKVKKFDITLNHCEYEDFGTFQSQIIQSNPLVTVVIPTLNRYEFLKDVLKLVCVLFHLKHLEDVLGHLNHHQDVLRHLKDVLKTSF